ncbi:MAG: phosphoribosylamine--glycine ligase [Candidatus Omnitrophota bacterium]|nr:phosphoribosylamine--glycine ligase [Candidatus Omnitrophota bacterium]
MRILVIGSGGREHALCWKLANSPRCSKIYCAPGNGGIQNSAELVNIGADDIEALIKFAKDKNIDFTVVGPEGPLVGGIVDRFQKEGLKIFGPSKAAAAIEGSKVFAKNLMKRAGVPTAAFEVFRDMDAALRYAKTKKLPLVVKADGLCAGKGVVICGTEEELRRALESMLVGKAFGEAGERVIIEDCLTGEEASIIVIADGKDVLPLASSQDHKRIFDGDMGPNTGGMGAYSPAPVVTKELFEKIMDTVIYPVINTLAKDGMPYKGALYAGIMVTGDGPAALEFNARFGDPETQVLLPRLKSDLVDVIERSISGHLAGLSLTWDPRPCVSVVMASGGYPGVYEKGMEIKGLDEAAAIKDTVVFHAGTMRGRRAADKDMTIITSGGRVLNVTALGDNMQAAIDNCYNAVRTIHFDKMHYRRDIGAKAPGRKLGS